MTLRTRILTLAASLVALFLSLIVYTLIVVSTASTELNRIIQRSLTVEKTVETLNSTILMVRSDIWDTMVFDPGRRTDQMSLLDTQAKNFYQGLRDVANLDPTFIPTTEALRTLFQGYYQFGTTILELKSLSDFVREGALVQKFRENQAQLLDQLAVLMTDSKGQFFGSMERLNADLRTTTVTAFGLAIGVTILSFLIAIVMAAHLARPLERLTKTVRQVSEGDYSIRPELTSSGEIRDLTETFIAMLDQIQDYSGRMEDLIQARTDALVRTNSLMVKELKLAQKIQSTLIPQRFPPGPLAAAGAYLPMEELGGDFYDLFEGSPGKWTLVMADVSGHGVPAALVTAMVKISLGVHGPQTSNPGQTLEEVNRELCAAIGDLKRYVTMVLCHIDIQAQTLSYCNAGHNELIVVRKSGDQELHGPNSGIVGLRPDELFLTRTIGFHPGDGLVLFTDGLVEARGREKVEFGLQRLLSLVKRHAGEGPVPLVDRLSTEVRTFSGTQPRQDDIALLSVRWDETPVNVPRPRPTLEGTLVHRTLSRAEELYRSREIAALLEWTTTGLTEELPPREVSRLHHWRAMGYHHQSRYEDALKAWDRALEADPENHRARRNRDLLERHLQEVHP